MLPWHISGEKLLQAWFLFRDNVGVIYQLLPFCIKNVLHARAPSLKNAETKTPDRTMKLS